METDVTYTLNIGATYDGYRISKTDIDLDDLILQLNAAKGWNLQSSSEIAFKRVNGDGDINFNSGDADSVLNLKQLMRDSPGDAGNLDFVYDGGGGTDMLSYRDDTFKVSMSVYDGPDGHDFYLNGGRGRNLNNNDLKLNSLEVRTKDVEVFELTKDDDIVDLSGWSGTYTVTIAGDKGDDDITGSEHADVLYGEKGNDTIDAGAGDDFVDPGDVNTGAQETITLGAGYDTLYLGDIGSTESDYQEVTSGLSNWESYAIDTGTALPATIFSAGMKSVFAAWTKSNPVTATVMAVSFEVGGAALGSLLTSIVGGSKAAESTYSGGSQASGITLADLNTTEDTIILPVTDFNAPDMSVTDAVAGKATFMLDAEDGGEFMDAFITNTEGDGLGSDNGDFTQFLTDVYLDANSSFITGYDIWDIHDKSTVNTALLTGAWDSRLVFSNLENASGQSQIRAAQGDNVLYDSLDPSVAGDVDFSAMASMLNSSLGDGDSAIIMGNVVGQDISLSSGRRYANGNDQSDTFTTVAAEDHVTYYVNGNDGNDLLEIGQLNGTNINFHGGDGIDVISFANAHVLGANDAPIQSTFGLSIDLRHDTHALVANTAAFEADAYNDTAPSAKLWSVEGIIGSSRSDKLFGNEDDNVLMSNGGGDHIEGGGGDDVIRGGAGWDRMFGDRHNGTDTSDDGDDYFYTGTNSDLIIGGGGSDTADFSEATQTGLTINLSATKAASGHWFFKDNSTTGTYVKVSGSGFDTSMSGIENVVATSGNDTVIGDGNANMLFGGAGDDTMTGGAGADVFSFASGFGSDTITDFSIEDSLVFEGLSTLELTLLSNSLAPWSSAVSIGTDHVTLTGYDLSALTLTYDTNSDGSVDAVLAYGRANDSTPLSDDEAVLYLASHGDLIEYYGYDLTGAKNHYEASGRDEGRQIDFDADQYLANYEDLQNAFGNDTSAAAAHFVVSGYFEGRTDADNLTDMLGEDAASASSDYGAGYDASKVLDGDSNTFNHTHSSDGTPALSIDLGGDAELELIRIENRNDGDAAHQAIVNARLAGATVHVLDDGRVQWTSEELTSDVVQFIDLHNVVGDEIRITSNDGDYLHVAELDIFGDFIL